ncbi:MAG: hypothetical protein EBS91_04275, partial [Betaproteobacteria bacterium]|nr:hypothetical protein [Betaproteobacteria bacterium]
ETCSDRLGALVVASAELWGGGGMGCGVLLQSLAHLLRECSRLRQDCSDAAVRAIPLCNFRISRRGG